VMLAKIISYSTMAVKHTSEAVLKIQPHEAVLKNNALEVGRDNIRFHAKK
jgi:hypothetical protein